MRRKKHEDHCGNWMDTYGDMVTLLLCFFVLLYAISAIDQGKWENLVRSLNPSAETVAEDVPPEPPSISDNTADETEETDESLSGLDFDSLYEELKKEVEARGLDADIDVKKGDGFTFITFRDNVFFDGDSYVLKNEGKEVLDAFADIMAPYSGDIKVVEVLGHTADVPNRNSTINDRFLSSNRATTVVVYLQDKEIIDASKLTSVGYGHYWPIADNQTSEGRARNRRVEILITKTDSVDKNLGEYYKEMNLYQN